MNSQQANASDEPKRGPGRPKGRLQAVPKAQASDEGEEFSLELGAYDAFYESVPAGEYTLGFTRADKTFWSYGRTVLPLWFKITDSGKHFDKSLVMFCCVSPRKGRKSIGQSSKFVRACTLALGHKPTRTDRLSTRLFHGRWFRASVKTIEKDCLGRKLSEAERYSVVHCLLEAVAGSSGTKNDESPSVGG